MGQLVWLDEHSLDFPDTAKALDDPNGLLAVGGDLSPERLITAYRRGIFPWFNPGQPYLWWSPSPRMVLIPSELHIGRSARKLLNKHPFSITVDQAFDRVIDSCASITRKNQDGTWITDEMQYAYGQLRQQGYAHSVETWHQDMLVGGLYGIAIGRAFFGESMFSLQSGASKVAFLTLVQHLLQWGYQLIDCQMHTDYLASFGAREITRVEYEDRLHAALGSGQIDNWSKKWGTNV